MEERRGARRYEVQTGELAVLPQAITVQVIDISTAGVLLQAGRAVEPGVRGALRMNIAGTPFTAEVQVQRMSPVTGGRDSGYHIGAAFVAISSEHRQMIERFTNQ